MTGSLDTAPRLVAELVGAVSTIPTVAGCVTNCSAYSDIPALDTIITHDDAITKARVVAVCVAVRIAVPEYRRIAVITGTIPIEPQFGAVVGTVISIIANPLDLVREVIVEKLLIHV